ncbi:MAG: hypothetical protein PWR18_941, partial [Synergistales bacterium]|nr:hypothetical protein [Synergistales bacterium]
TTFLAARNQTPRFHAGLRAQKADFGQITVKEKPGPQSRELYNCKISRGSVPTYGVAGGLFCARHSVYQKNASFPRTGATVQRQAR